MASFPRQPILLTQKNFVHSPGYDHTVHTPIYTPHIYTPYTDISGNTNPSTAPMKVHFTHKLRNYAESPDLGNWKKNEANKIFGATGKIQGLCEFYLHLDAQSQFNNKLIASICFTIAQG